MIEKPNDPLTGAERATLGVEDMVIAMGNVPKSVSNNNNNVWAVLSWAR
jgi:hypothetical protein